MDQLSEKAMDLNDFLGPNKRPIDLQASNRWEAIDELINHLVANHKIKAEHKEAITESLKKRERSMSTGIGYGIGIPHVTTPLITEVIGAIGHSRKGIQFDALDGKPVKIVMLFLVPQDQFQKHLHTLSNLVKLLQNKDFRDGLDAE
jgi:mannitol/fructose-specific phosphotransferase system IIA component (Ntr-type)